MKADIKDRFSFLTIPHNVMKADIKNRFSFPTISHNVMKADISFPTIVLNNNETYRSY